MSASSCFSISVCTGMLTLHDPSCLHFENPRMNHFRLHIVLTDSGPGDANTTALVDVFVTNLNEPPTVTNGDLQIVEGSPPGASVGNYSTATRQVLPTPLSAYTRDEDAADSHAFALISVGTDEHGGGTVSADTGADAENACAATDRWFRIADRASGQVVLCPGRSCCGVLHPLSLHWEAL